MSIFPTKILLATEGSEEAELALQTATDLAEHTGSELHIVFVEVSSCVFSSTDWESVGGEDLPAWTKCLRRRTRPKLKNRCRSQALSRGV